MAELRFGGGINQLSDELVNPDECIEGENFLLDADSREFRPRPSFDLKGTCPNGANVDSIMQLVKRDNTETTLVKAGTLVYTWDGSTTFTPVATVATAALFRSSYWALDEVLCITDLNKQEVVKQWNGSSFATMTHAAPGVTSLYAKYSAVWQGRLWLFNIKTDSTDLPHVILASEFENYDSFDTTKTPTSTTLTAGVAFFLTAPDLKAINGVAQFYDTLVVSTNEGRLFKITGTDSTNYAVEEFYSGSSAAGEELITNIGNDIIYVRKGGRVERLLATQNYGDTQADDVSRFIPDEVANLASGLVVYDQNEQRVCFFVNNSILVVDKYIMETRDFSPWMKWTTQMTSNLDVTAAAYIKRPGTQNRSVYFGGPAGQIYDLNGIGSSDAGSTLIKAYRKSKLISELPSYDNNMLGRITYRRRGECTLEMTWEWTDEYTDTTNAVPLKDLITMVGTYFWGSSATPSYWGGDTYWSTGGVQEPRVSTVGFSAIGKSPSFFLTLSINSSVNFQILKIEVP
jgi:hypothetical protein